ncbi:unnamed protein product [Pedinophyceae sp. YPF-701]|nr:unnamed protein product [Pedinophyceae sp. YPF-701]
MGAEEAERRRAEAASELQAARDQQERLRARIVAIASEALQELKQRGCDPANMDRSGDAAAVPVELAVIDRTLVCTEQLMDVQQRAANMLAQQGSFQGESLQEALAAAVASREFGTQCTGPDLGDLPPELRELTSAVQEKAREAQGSMRVALLSAVRTVLRGAEWPPDLATIEKAMGSGAWEASWGHHNLFGGQEGLQRKMVALAGACHAMQASIAAAGVGGAGGGRLADISWAAIELARPLQERMMYHCSTQLQQGPGAALQAVLMYASKAAKAMPQLLLSIQADLEKERAHGPTPLGSDFVRAVEHFARGVLDVQVVPELAAALQGRKTDDVWSLVETLLEFETSMTSAMGVPESPPEPQDFVWCDSAQRPPAETCLGLLHEPPLADILREYQVSKVRHIVEEALDQPQGWDPASNEEMAAHRLSAPPSSIWSTGRTLSRGPSSVHRSHRGDARPTRASCGIFKAIDLVPVYLTASAHGAEGSADLLSCLTEAVMAPVLARLEREGEVMGAFEDVNSQQWIRRAAGVVNTVQHVAESLEELCLHPATAAVPHGDAAVSRHVAGLEKLRRRWSLRVAAAVDTRLLERLAPYLADHARFRAEWSDEAAAGLPEPAAHTLYPALELLHSTLTALQDALNLVSFRQVWCAVAQGISHHLFEGLVMEVRYTPLGAQRLLNDVSAIANCFSAFTPRPWPHVRELMEACRVMMLETRKAAKALKVLVEVLPDTGEESIEGRQVLDELGLTVVDTDQAVVILSNRIIDAPHSPQAGGAGAEDAAEGGAAAYADGDGWEGAAL